MPKKGINMDGDDIFNSLSEEELAVLGEVLFETLDVKVEEENYDN